MTLLSRNRLLEILNASPEEFTKEAFLSALETSDLRFHVCQCRECRMYQVSEEMPDQGHCRVHGYFFPPEFFCAQGEPYTTV